MPLFSGEKPATPGHPSIQLTTANEKEAIERINNEHRKKNMQRMAGSRHLATDAVGQRSAVCQQRQRPKASSKQQHRNTITKTKALIDESDRTEATVDISDRSSSSEQRWSYRGEIDTSSSTNATASCPVTTNAHDLADVGGPPPCLGHTDQLAKKKKKKVRFSPRTKVNFIARTTSTSQNELKGFSFFMQSDTQLDSARDTILLLICSLSFFMY